MIRAHRRRHPWLIGIIGILAGTLLFLAATGPRGPAIMDPLPTVLAGGERFSLQFNDPTVRGVLAVLGSGRGQLTIRVDEAYDTLTLAWRDADTTTAAQVVLGTLVGSASGTFALSGPLSRFAHGSIAIVARDLRKPIAVAAWPTTGAGQ